MVARGIKAASLDRTACKAVPGTTSLGLGGFQLLWEKVWGVPGARKRRSPAFCFRQVLLSGLALYRPGQKEAGRCCWLYPPPEGPKGHGGRVVRCFHRGHTESGRLLCACRVPTLPLSSERLVQADTFPPHLRDRKKGNLNKKLNVQRS